MGDQLTSTSQASAISPNLDSPDVKKEIFNNFPASSPARMDAEINEAAPSRLARGSPAAKGGERPMLSIVKSLESFVESVDVTTESNIYSKVAKLPAIDTETRKRKYSNLSKNQSVGTSCEWRRGHEEPLDLRTSGRFISPDTEPSNPPSECALSQLELKFGSASSLWQNKKPSIPRRAAPEAFWYRAFNGEVAANKSVRDTGVSSSNFANNSPPSLSSYINGDDKTQAEPSDSNSAPATDDILTCKNCSFRFESLQALTLHMVQAEHYNNLLSNLRSDFSPAGSPDSIFDRLHSTSAENEDVVKGADGRVSVKSESVERDVAMPTKEECLDFKRLQRNTTDKSFTAKRPVNTSVNALSKMEDFVENRIREQELRDPYNSVVPPVSFIPWINPWFPMFNNITAFAPMPFFSSTFPASHYSNAQIAHSLNGARGDPNIKTNFDSKQVGSPLASKTSPLNKLEELTRPKNTERKSLEIPATRASPSQFLSESLRDDFIKSDKSGRTTDAFRDFTNWQRNLSGSVFENETKSAVGKARYNDRRENCKQQEMYTASRPVASSSSCVNTSVVDKFQRYQLMAIELSNKGAIA